MRKKSIKILFLITALFTLLFTNVVCEALAKYCYIEVIETPNGRIEAPASVRDGYPLDITVTPDEGYVLSSLIVKKKSFLTPTIEKTNFFGKLLISSDEIISYTLSEDYESDDGTPALDIELTEENLEVDIIIDVQGDRKIVTNGISPIRISGKANLGFTISFTSSTGGSLEVYDKSGNNEPVNIAENMTVDGLSYDIEENKLIRNFSFLYTKVSDNVYRVEEVKNDLTISGIFVKENITPSIEINENHEYTGNEIKPNIVVKDEDNNIIASDKYVVTYENNIEVGTGTLRVTNIDGEYPRFDKSVNFNIKNPGNIEQKQDETNYGKAIIANEDELDNIITLTEEEKCSRASGKKIYSFIEVKELEETDDLKDLIKDKIKENTKELIYLDVSLFKQVEGQEKEKITTTGRKIKVAIDLPKEIETTGNFYIIREHAGNVELIDAKIEGDKLVFETDRFSTYVIGYTDVVNPGTGDPILLFVGGLLLSMICLVVAIKFYRK